MACFVSAYRHSYSFVSNLRLSRHTFATSISNFCYLLLCLTHFKGFHYLDRLVNNVHPSRRNLVTLPYPLKGFRYLDRLVGKVHLSRRNPVTLPYPLMGFRCQNGLVSTLHPSWRNLVTLILLMIGSAHTKTSGEKLVY